MPHSAFLFLCYIVCILYGMSSAIVCVCVWVCVCAIKKDLQHLSISSIMNEILCFIAFLSLFRFQQETINYPHLDFLAKNKFYLVFIFFSNKRSFIWRSTEVMVMYNLNAFWHSFSKCVMFVQNLTHIEKNFSKCVDLVPNLNHFESAYFFKVRCHTADSFISRVKKRCRDKVAPIPSIYDEEVGALRNADCDDSVLDMISLPVLQFWAAPESRENRAKTSHHTKRTYPAGSMDTDPCSWEISFKRWQRWCRKPHNCVCHWGKSSEIVCIINCTCIQWYNSLLFAQLYTLHADDDETVIPLVSDILTNKTERTYRRFFSILKSAMNDRQSVLTPRIIWPRWPKNHQRNGRMAPQNKT